MLSAVAAVMAVPIVWPPSAGAAGRPSTFAVYRSAEQVAITHATPDATVTLDDAAGTRIAHGTFDAQGSFLFRRVRAGDGDRVVENDDGTRGESASVTVRSASAVPRPSFYRTQRLQTSSAYGNGETSSTAPTASVGPASDTPTKTAHHSGGLPFTGGDVLGLTFIGIGLVLMGTAFMATPRGRARTPDVPADS